MKKLIPSHREKKRYLLIKGEEPNYEDIEKAILDYIGILGYSKTGVERIKSRNNTLIIAINRGMLNEVKASLLLSGKRMEVIKVSGSVKNLK